MSSLGLTLYSLTARHGAADNPRPTRPSGLLICLIASSDDDIEAAEILARRLLGMRECHILIAASLKKIQAMPAQNGMIVCQVPADHPASVDSFLAHWQPDAIVMLGSFLRPALIDAAFARGVSLLMVQAQKPHLLRSMDRLFFGLTKQAIQAFHTIMTVDEASAIECRKLGARNVLRLGRIEPASTALPHNEPERAAMARQFQTRPVWLAVDVPPEEEAAVIAAHRAALRRAHRLLLILVPDNPARAPELAQSLEESEGWVVARRELDQEPDPETAVYIADAGQEYGLWYRLAPVTFMGGSLGGAGSARSPMEPAALGSAIIHGRKTGSYGAAYGRLGAALGAAPVTNETELADFLTELLAPDRVARMAHAAWAMVSEGAVVTDRIANTILQLCERKG